MLGSMATGRATNDTTVQRRCAKRHRMIRRSCANVGRSARTLVALTLGIALAVTAVSGAAADRVREHGRLPDRGDALAAGCTPCHQAAPSPIPILAGQSQAALRAKLEAFRDGTLTGTVMPQLARGYTPAEIDALAGWFARQHRAANGTASERSGH